MSTPKPQSGVVLIGSAAEDLASIIDESSPDTRQTGRCKVPIYAQVIRENSLDWFFDLLALHPDVPSELKSARVIESLESLPLHSRARIWSGLREVRIHVTDPRPYLEDRNRIYFSVVGKPFPFDELRYAARKGDQNARDFLNVSEDFVARMILHESVPYRLAQRLVLIDGTSGMIARLHNMQAPMGFDPEAELQALKSKRNSAIGRVAEWASKAAPAFTDALDQAISPLVDSQPQRFWNLSALIREAVCKEFSRGHGYDQGDEKLLSRIQALRNAFADRVASELWEEGLSVAQRGSGELRSLVSSEVMEAQASDIAAGVASAIFGREGLAGVVKRWSYVTYNGGRVTENSVEEHLRRVRAIHPAQS